MTTRERKILADTLQRVYELPFCIFALPVVLAIIIYQMYVMGVMEALTDSKWRNDLASNLPHSKLLDHGLYIVSWGIIINLAYTL